MQQINAHRAIFDMCPDPVKNIFHSMPAELQKHCKNVAELMLIISEFSNDTISDRKKMVIYSAGLLHDIGKLYIYYGIVSKPGKLSKKEYARMQEHVLYGVKLYKGLHLEDSFTKEECEKIYDVILYHHERYDGRGYIHKLSNTEIPKIARLCTLADSYDAMVSDRVYRKGMTADRALEIIREEVGEQFDPDMASLFIQNFGELQNYANY